MVHCRNDEELALLRQSAALVSRTLAHLAGIIQPGIRTIALDRAAEMFIRDSGGIPAFKNYKGFPSSICVSVNEEVVHGIPGERILMEGDIVSVDVGVEMNGYFGDSAYTFPVGEVSPDAQRLLRVTRLSLDLAIQQAVTGRRLGDIGYAVQEYVENRNGMSVVRDLVGHGIGRELHEDPEVPNFGKRGHGMLLKTGMVLAIEPMVNLGKSKVFYADDGWTVITADRFLSAHFEHTIAVAPGKAEVLTDFGVIEQKTEV